MSPGKDLPPSVVRSKQTSALKTLKQQQGPRAWLTVLTSASYLPGVILLNHSLRKSNSAYPLIVCCTPSLPQKVIQALEEEGLEVRVISPVKPKNEVKVVADRFEETWSKLGVFGMEDLEKAVLLDGDMLIRRNMDELFDLDLPAGWIAANHACVCNLDDAPWAPADWRKENCAYTPLAHPAALLTPTAITPSSRRTHTLLNSGLVVFTPARSLFTRMLHLLHTEPALIAGFAFPDQDFLAHFFRGRWAPLGWQWNAIKTMRHWHPEIWRDDEVRNCHHICAKPWQDKGRVPPEPEDAVTHGWWWDEWDEWKRERVGEGREGTVRTVEEWVAA